MKDIKYKRLPDNVLLRVFQEAKLNPLELATVGRVDKQWFRVSTLDALWEDDTPLILKKPSRGGQNPLYPEQAEMSFRTAFLARAQGRGREDNKLYVRLLRAPESFQPGELRIMIGWQNARPDMSALRVPTPYRPIIEHFLFSTADFDITKAFIQLPTKCWNFAIRPLFSASHLQMMQEPIIAKVAVPAEPPMFEFVGQALQDNEALFLSSLNHAHATLAFASVRLKDSRSLVDRAVAINPKNYIFASETQRSRQDLLMSALSGQNRRLDSANFPIERIPQALLEDPDVASIIARSVANSVPRLPEPARSSAEILGEGIRQAGHSTMMLKAMYDAIPRNLKTSPSFMIGLVKKNPLLVEVFDEFLWRDVYFARQVASISPRETLVRSHVARSDVDAIRAAITSSSERHPGRFIVWAALAHSPAP